MDVRFVVALGGKADLARMSIRTPLARFSMPPVYGIERAPFVYSLSVNNLHFPGLPIKRPIWPTFRLAFR
jgi:hypothetical protein